MSIKTYPGSYYVGNQQDDYLLLTSKQLSKARVELGAGVDTLAVSAAGSYSFGPTSFSRLKGVDVIDLSRAAGGALSVTLNDLMVGQSDANQLTIVSGAGGIDSFSTSGVTSGTVMIAGTGDVHLADAGSNKVRIADNSSVSVFGGAGADTIIAASTGSALDGGGGADKLAAGAGSDTILLRAGGGADIVTGFDAAFDRIELSGHSFASLNALLDLTLDTLDGALINFTGGGSVLFQGLSEAALAAAFISSDGQQLLHVPPTILVGTQTSAAQLNAMIASAEAGSIFVLSDGVHEFSEPIVISRSDISLTGQSEAGTILRFSFAADAEADAIQVSGGAKTYLGLAQQAVAAGQDVIALPAGHGLSAGDSIYIYQPNTQDYLTQNGWTNVAWADADQRPFREFIVEIESVDGNVAHLKHPAPYAMDLGETRVFSIDLLENVVLSGFTLTYDLGAANAYDFVNAQPAFDGLSAMQLTGVNGARLSDISILDAASIGISVTSSIGVIGDNLYVNGALNKGSDGNGYSLLLTETFNSHFTGLDLLNGRHAVILSAWSAETGNLIDVTSTNRDINFHGSPDLGNVIMVGRGVLDYVPVLNTSGQSAIWSIVSQGGTNHASTNIYPANSVEFNYAVGSAANDEIHGTAGSDYLNAAFGYDTIMGGGGQDYIVGGTRRDVMEGGTGSDTFLLKMGDDLDRITDFAFGADGDTLIFAGNAAVISTANLTFTQNGADLYVRYGANSTVILAGHTFADVNTANFSFDASGTQTQAAYDGTFAL